MRELIHQSDLGLACQDGVHIHFLDDDGAVDVAAARDDLQAIEERCRLPAAVGLDQAHHNVDALAFQPVGLFEHLPGFPDAGAISEIDLELSPLGAADHAQETVGSVLSHGPASSSRWVQIEVELEHVHARLAQESQVAPLGVGFDLPADGLEAHAPGPGHAGGL